MEHGDRNQNLNPLNKMKNEVSGEILCNKMVVGGIRQETLDPVFVLLGTRQQGVPVILRELVLPGCKLI
ncbi:unnamed protein product [Schistosoma mattheei]|uniref:Uncharacterized protein n=1 Tax=Schistosoma mattheei TaxID=31246 RepID=A0A183PU05_9TREM|nr:unnamed protein product [Schistosoma mattheei]